MGTSFRSANTINKRNLLKLSVRHGSNYLPSFVINALIITNFNYFLSHRHR